MEAQHADEPTPGARAIALTFRAYDADLDDAQIEQIARRIDANRAAGLTLSRRPQRLRNGDEMVARYAVDESDGA